MTPYLAGIIYGVVLGAAATAVVMVLWAAYRRPHGALAQSAVVRVVHLESQEHLLQYFNLSCDDCDQKWSGASAQPALTLSRRIRALAEVLREDRP